VEAKQTKGKPGHSRRKKIKVEDPTRLKRKVANIETLQQDEVGKGDEKGKKGGLRGL